jgi:hypothetical protein
MADFIIPWHSFNERAVNFLANLIQMEVQTKRNVANR